MARDDPVATHSVRESIASATTTVSAALTISAKLMGMTWAPALQATASIAHSPIPTRRICPYMRSAPQVGLRRARTSPTLPGVHILSIVSPGSRAKTIRS